MLLLVVFLGCLFLLSSWEWRVASCWVDFWCGSMKLVILWMISVKAVSFYMYDGSCCMY